MTKPIIELAIDSGAFSAWSLGKVIILKDYIEFCKKNEASIAHVVNLDVIDKVNPEHAAEAGRKNFLEMRDAGVSAIPVYHARERIHHLARMCDDTDYIGLSGTSLVSPVEVKLFYNMCYEYLTDKDGCPIVKTHLFGDSVAGNSLILIKQAGRIRVDTIEAIYQSAPWPIIRTEDKRQIRELDDIETLVPINGKAVWKKVKAVHKHWTNKQRSKVKTRRGKEVELTNDHGIFAYTGEDLNGKLVSPLELTPKESNVIGIQPSLASIQEGCNQLCEYVYDMYFRVFTRRANKGDIGNRKIPYRILFDKELLEFLGLWLADGAVERAGENNYAGVDVSAANDIECRELLERIAIRFRKKLNVCDNGVDSAIYSTLLEQIVKALFGATSFASHTKEVPWWVFQLSEENICSFLRGYFSGDGSAGKGNEAHASCTSASPKLTHAIYYLLSSLGIRARLDYSPPDPEADYKGNYVMNGITISDEENLRLFHQKIGFLQKRKNDEIGRFLSKEKRSGGFQKGVKDPKIEEIETILVKTVEPLGNDLKIVYDLEVPGVEKFVANGIVVHNTSPYSLLNFPAYSADSATWMIQAGRAARVNLDGKSYQLRSTKRRDTSYIDNDDTGPKRQSWEEALTRLGLNPERVMNVKTTRSEMAMIRAYLVLSELLRLQERSKHVTTFKKGLSLISSKRQQEGGKAREGACKIYAVLSPSAYYFNFPIVTMLGLKQVLVSYYYVADAPTKFWPERLMPFLYDPLGYCESNPKVLRYLDKLRECLLKPDVIVQGG